MGKPWQPMNMRSFDLQFDKMEKETAAYMVAVLKKTAQTCFMNILETDNPPFKTGSYMASHRIGVNIENTSDTVFHTVGVLSLENAIKRSATELPKLAAVNSVSDTVTISNSVGYSTKYGFSWAAKVEYVGWGGKGEYLVYEKAVEKTMRQLPNIAKTISITDIKVVG